MMPLHDLVLELETVTRELGEACAGDDERFQTVMRRRSLIIERIATTPPGSFAAADLDSLRATLRNSSIVIEDLTLKRRRLASEWLRLQMSKPVAEPPAAAEISVRG